jgi:alpha-tubulin suppressor-like RCC1 family protein
MMRLTPVAVATTERFASLTVGGAHACGTTSDGIIWCWGNNLNGALGDGTDFPRSSPVSVMTANPLRLVSAGGSHTCAVTLQSLAQCWGANGFGQLGIGSFATSTFPVSASLATNMRLLAAGPNYTCGISAGAVTGTDGVIVVVSTVALLCWGDNAGGQFGTGDRISSRAPVGAAFGITFR